MEIKGASLHPDDSRSPTSEPESQAGAASSDAKPIAGSSYDPVPEPGSFVDDRPVLHYVDPSRRTELERFERVDEAELACGLLRSNNIACELSPMLLPGLPAEIVLWVDTQDAELAWALLADAEREASAKNDDAA